jgi:hypothetical protein
MSLRTVELERDLPKLLDRADFENVSDSDDAELSRRLRKTFEDWKHERNQARS